MSSSAPLPLLKMWPHSLLNTCPSVRVWICPPQLVVSHQQWWQGLPGSPTGTDNLVTSIYHMSTMRQQLPQESESLPSQQWEQGHQPGVIEGRMVPRTLEDRLKLRPAFINLWTMSYCSERTLQHRWQSGHKQAYDHFDGKRRQSKTSINSRTSVSKGNNRWTPPKKRARANTLDDVTCASSERLRRNTHAYKSTGERSQTSSADQKTCRRSPPLEVSLSDPWTVHAAWLGCSPERQRQWLLLLLPSPWDSRAHVHSTLCCVHSHRALCCVHSHGALCCVHIHSTPCCLQIYSTLCCIHNTQCCVHIHSSLLCSHSQYSLLCSHSQHTVLC